MGHSAKILADSITEVGDRLTTYEVTYPRIIHAEVMTHRLFARSAASSRAIPVKKMIREVEDNPYVPSHWGKNQKGMRAHEDLSVSRQRKATAAWLKARDNAVASATELLEIGLHKQLTNRLLEPFQWYTVIITATEWSNFFNLRKSYDAHPDIQILARGMEKERNESSPLLLGEGFYHLPLIRQEDQEEGLERDELIKISCARCARVSYMTHQGERDTSKDLALYDRLLSSGHMSPLEHVARPMNSSELIEYRTVYSNVDLTCGTYTRKSPFLGSFRGWVSHRKEIPGEDDVVAHRKAWEAAL